MASRINADWADWALALITKWITVLIRVRGTFIRMLATCSGLKYPDLMTPGFIHYHVFPHTGCTQVRYVSQYICTKAVSHRPQYTASWALLLESMILNIESYLAVNKDKYFFTILYWKFEVVIIKMTKKRSEILSEFLWYTRYEILKKLKNVDPLWHDTM